MLKFLSKKINNLQIFPNWQSRSGVEILITYFYAAEVYTI